MVVAPKNTNNIEKTDRGLLFCPKYIISGPIKNISSSLIICDFIPSVDMYPINNPNAIITYVKTVMFIKYKEIFFHTLVYTYIPIHG
jgi:hypothetical protein